MAREISRAEAWERAHEVYTQLNFNSFDFNSIKQSLIDYMRLYFPEDFNDYIESSEFIAILELFAYVGELLAYRSDMNAHENFITTAQRKESVLRLAKMISYKATRNIPNRGLVKITSVRTTDTVYDSQSRNLTDRTVLWNDPNNTDWKEQFLLIMNRLMVQNFGTVSPEDRVQVDDVLFELYTLNNNPISSQSTTVLPYTAQVSGQSLPMELVPTALTSTGPEEKRPEVNAKFTVMYASDGLGDGSDTTGFLAFTKQGSLQKQQTTFDGTTPNQTMTLSVDNINDTDLFINNVDADTRTILETDPFASELPHLSSTELRYGEWVEVDLSNGQNIMFNTNSNRSKYETETLANDQVKIIFGDGEFANIPNGAFDIWYRTSVDQNIAIPSTAVVNQTASLSYTDATGSIQTITFTFSLVNSLQNGSASETIEHIRRVAPSVYYTQDRMVNGRDYNSFMLQDPSILKMRAVNRTFSGDSKYIAWHDPKEYYEDVKIFGNDLALFWEEHEPYNGGTAQNSTSLNSTDVRVQLIEPLLESTDVFAIIAPQLLSLGASYTSVRRTFNSEAVAPYTISEQTEIDAALLDAYNGEKPYVDLYYSLTADNVDTGGHWFVNPDTGSTIFTLLYPTPTFIFRIESVFSNGTHTGWIVRHRTRRLIANSPTTKFWNTTQTDVTTNFDSLDSVSDTMVVLAANVDATNTAILSENKNFGVLAQKLISQNLPDAGLADPNQLYVLPEDTNSDGISDDMLQEELFGTTEPTYVYFMRESTTSAWKPQLESAEILALVETDSTKAEDEKLYKKCEGRFPLNFAWLHSTPNLNLIDPAATNIIDMYIITVGYYTELVRYLSGLIDNAPTKPTSYELRNTYSSLLDNKMISDTVILHPGTFKLLFGSRAAESLQARFKVVRPTQTTLTSNEVKVRIVEIIQTFFDINYWEFGESFFFTELVASIHAELGSEIDSVVIVPTNSQTQFGDLFQIQSTENEMFIPDISTSDIDIIDTLTPTNIKQTP